MCGIIGYTGASPALSMVIDSLRKLEYRGYDSAGIALTGKDFKSIQEALERDKFMSPEEAKDFGIIDKVVEKKAD